MVLCILRHFAMQYSQLTYFHLFHGGTPTIGICKCKVVNCTCHEVDSFHLDSHLPIIMRYL